MIEPAPHPPDEVEALLEDHEDDPPPVDSAPELPRWPLVDVDDPHVRRAGVWSCY